MVHEELAIRQLAVGEQVAGKYRGHRFHQGQDMGRVFLDTEDGPMAVGGNNHMARQLEELQPTDGDSIIVRRISEDSYTVVKEVPDAEPEG